jgi:hypothetical protein
MDALAEFKKEYDLLCARKMELVRSGLRDAARKIQELIDQIPMQVIWADEFKNTVTNVGKAYILNNAFTSGSVGAPSNMYLGLISATAAFSTPAATDTMASHANWTEAGATVNAAVVQPSVAARLAASFNTSVGASISTGATSFTMTGAGSLAGCFLAIGASSAVGNTSGTLISAGAFSTGSQPVSANNVVAVTYQMSL